MQVFASVDHHLHRSRRNAFESLFSKQGVRGMESVIRTKVDLLCQSVREHTAYSDNGIVELRAPLLAFGTDVINHCAYGASPRAELLTNLKDQLHYQDTIYTFEDGIPIVKQFSWALGILKFIPSWLAQLISANLATVVNINEVGKSDHSAHQSSTGADCSVRQPSESQNKS